MREREKWSRRRERRTIRRKRKTRGGSNIYWDGRRRAEGEKGEVCIEENIYSLGGRRGRNIIKGYY